MRRQFSCGASLAACHLCCCCFCWGARYYPRGDFDSPICNRAANCTNSNQANVVRKRPAFSSFSLFSLKKTFCQQNGNRSCTDSFMQSVTLEAPAGNILGRIQQELVDLFLLKHKIMHHPKYFNKTGITIWQRPIFHRDKELRHIF